MPTGQEVIPTNGIDYQYHLSADLPYEASFGFINGHLIVGSAHHQLIMAALLKQGWTWEQMMDAEQAWGWMSVRAYNDYGDYLPEPTLKVRFTSDAGYQNETAKQEATQALANYYRLPVNVSNSHSGVNETSGEYGTGLGGKKNIDNYLRLDNKDTERWVHTPVPPPPTITSKLAFQWDSDYWRTQNLPRDGCFGCVDGHLVLGSKHHQMIMAAFIDKGWTWAQLANAQQAWGWYSVRGSSSSYSSPFPDAESEEARAMPWLSVSFASDAGYQNEEAREDAEIQFRKLYHLIVKVDPYLKGVETKGTGYGEGLHGKGFADHYAPGGKYHHVMKDGVAIDMVPDPPREENTVEEIKPGDQFQSFGDGPIWTVQTVSNNEVTARNEEGEEQTYALEHLNAWIEQGMFTKVQQATPTEQVQQVTPTKQAPVSEQPQVGENPATTHIPQKGDKFVTTNGLIYELTNKTKAGVFFDVYDSQGSKFKAPVNWSTEIFKKYLADGTFTLLNAAQPVNQVGDAITKSDADFIVEYLKPGIQFKSTTGLGIVYTIKDVDNADNQFTMTWEENDEYEMSIFSFDLLKVWLDSGVLEPLNPKVLVPQPGGGTPPPKKNQKQQLPYQPGDVLYSPTYNMSFKVVSADTKITVLDHGTPDMRAEAYPTASLIGSINAGEYQVQKSAKMWREAAGLADQPAKFVWADGVFELMPGVGKAHHWSLMASIVSKLGHPPQNYIGGDWTPSPFHAGMGNIKVIWHQGSGLPSPDELKQLILSQNSATI